MSVEHNRLHVSFPKLAIFALCFLAPCCWLLVIPIRAVSSYGSSPWKIKLDNIKEVGYVFLWVNGFELYTLT